MSIADIAIVTNSLSTLTMALLYWQ